MIKRPGVKNDLIDLPGQPLLNPPVPGLAKSIVYLIEVACNEMFGNFADGFLTPVDPNRVFRLKKCEVALFCREAFDLFHDFAVLRDCATHLAQEQHHRADDALRIANAIVNECDEPFNLKKYAKCRGIADEFLSRTNSAS